MRIERAESGNLRRLIQPWQHRALAFYETLGEVNFAGQFYARTLSKIRYFAAELDDNGDPQESENPALIELWNRVQDPGGGRTNLLTAYGQLMFLCGDCYLVCSADPDYDEKWEILSVAELRATDNGRFQRVVAPGLGFEELISAPDDAFEPMEGEVIVYRLYRPDPRFRKLADSPLRGVLGLCEELTLLDLEVRSRAKSRIANAGLLFLNDSISPPDPTRNDDDDPMSDPFFRDLFNGMMAPIADPGSAAAVVPLVVRVNGELIAAKSVAEFIKFADPSTDAQHSQDREATIKRMAIDMDFPIEYLLGMTDANHWCTDSETEILTRDRGWVGHDALSIGDVVRTLNHETGLAEWQPVEDIYRADVVDEPMRKLESRTHSSLTTLGHRWPVLRERYDNGRRYMAREWATTRELLQQHTIITGAFAGDGPELATRSDDLVELAAWFWTEGSIHGKIDKGITIAQSHTKNPDRVARIRGCLASLYGPSVEKMRLLTKPAWRETIQPNTSSHGGPITVFTLNRHAAAPVLEVVPEKHLDPRFLCNLTRAQLDLFIDVSCQGDGHHYASGELDLWQRDPAALDGYELAVVLSGRASSRQPSHDDGTVVRALRSLGVRPVKAAEEADRIGNDSGATDELVAYTGTIWCPTTANHTWLARRGGRTFFTGNSSWLVDEQSWKAHLMPVTQRLCDDFGSAYLRPAAKDADISGVDWKRVVVGYDAAEVINHPDKAKDAQGAYDRRVVSKEYYRNAIGATDDDAMPQEEIFEQLGVAIRDGSLAVYGIPGIKAGGVETKPGEIVDATGEHIAPTDVGAGKGAEADKGPPAEPSDVRTAAALPFDVGRIVGAAESHLERARELAGNRLRNRSKGCHPCQDAIQDQPAAMVASLLGVDQAHAVLAGGATERDLVAGTAEAFARAASRFGVPDEWALELGGLVETHAARTLYEPEAPPLPASFAALTVRALQAPESVAA